jgi:hypothetical protein
MKIRALLGCLLLVCITAAYAQAPQPVTVDNFVRAESDLYFGRILKDSGGALGKFNHRREVASVDHQTVIRLNRDTIVLGAVRSRGRPCNDHSPRRGQTLPVDAGDQRGPLRADGGLRCGRAHADARQRRHALRGGVAAFWSISVYNAEGYYQKNELNSYTINSITGKKAADGSTTVQFGGCDGKIRTVFRS